MREETNFKKIDANVCPHCGTQNPPHHTGCTGCGSDLTPYFGPGPDAVSAKPAPIEMLKMPSDDWHCSLENCAILGGFGLAMARYARATLSFETQGVTVFTHGVEPMSAPWSDVLALDIAGPGQVRSGGGFIGGGFGLGALVGMGVASALNSATTSTNIYTYIHLETVDGEAFFHYTGAEPSVVRIRLSPVFVTLRQMRSTGMPGSGSTQ